MAGHLLDTPVLSELIKPAPQPAVVSWIDAANEAMLYVSVLTLGELRKGVSRLPLSQRREALEQWLMHDVVSRFRGRLLSVDAATALEWGALQGAALRAGLPLPAVDALIAATARVHALTIVTRNVRDLERCGVPIVNPWQAAV